ncbi:MAG: hypothetical protein L0332_02995 [Chloroflexi bacterium]|nr:hypothetical protein [Chloroflexota bacterium]MCI0577168.1 hypothetical protein [Chloroflexota bacterium]MCI0649907.1 hypothetical protein [Chloroflexota bacterium]MCI0725677.1 hypothetical protein [Chloroflexota bacterium]
MEEEPEKTESADWIDSLRDKSARASTIYDDLGEQAPSAKGGGLSGLSPQQRLILALLVFLNILAFACAALVLSGQINLF